MSVFEEDYISGYLTQIIGVYKPDMWTSCLGLCPDWITLKIPFIYVWGVDNELPEIAKGCPR
jgi:hypothetical protein